MFPPTYVVFRVLVFCFLFDDGGSCFRMLFNMSSSPNHFCCAILCLPKRFLFLVQVFVSLVGLYCGLMRGFVVVSVSAYLRSYRVVFFVDLDSFAL